MKGCETTILHVYLVVHLQRFLYLLVTYLFIYAHVGKGLPTYCVTRTVAHVGKGLPTYCVTRTVGRQPFAANDFKT